MMASDRSRAARNTLVSRPARINDAKLERLCRYISRLAISQKRLSLTRNGNVRYELKTP